MNNKYQVKKKKKQLYGPACVSKGDKIEANLTL